MIKGNELRIGNYVMASRYRSNKLFLTQVETLSKSWTDLGYTLVLNDKFVATGENFGSCLEKEVMPINLTQEWLINFGFKLNKDTSIWHLGCYQIFEDELGFFYFCLFRLGEWHHHIEYAHTLQNLYFCITNGEELTISEEMIMEFNKKISTIKK